MDSLFASFTEDILKTEVRKRMPKSGYLKRCRGLALITNISEKGAESSGGRAAIFDLMVLTVSPSDPANPNDVNTVGEAVSKWFKFEDGNAQKRSVIRADFKRQLCSIFGVDPSTLTAEQYKAMGKAVAEGKCVGMLLKYEPRVSDKGMVFHDFYPASGKNSPAEVAKRATLLANGASPEAFV